MQKLNRILVSLLVLSPSAIWADPVFNNGAPVEQDLGLRYNYAQYTVFDQFVVAQRTHVTGILWSQFDEVLSYDGSTITIYDGLPAPSTLVATLM